MRRIDVPKGPKEETHRYIDALGLPRDRGTVLGWASEARPARGGASGPAGARGRSGAPSGWGGGQRQLAAASSISSVSPRVRLGSTGTPGPIVVVNVIFLTYRPLAAAGLSLTTSSIAAA
jgi:hypothetical protein